MDREETGATGPDAASALLSGLGEQPSEFLYVNVAQQRLIHVRAAGSSLSYPVSTSAWGVGSEAGSNKTPPGVHRIKEKIGHGAPLRRIFRSRQDTGQDSPPDDSGENLILTRILRLEGMQEGVNKGPGIDSYDRYIYIHGTNREEKIGTPFSHGCVLMRNEDVVELFGSVSEGTIVVIDPGQTA